MTPPLSIGDEVEIIGQNVHNNSLRLGQKFTIEQIIIDNKYGTMYSAPGQLGFPASSLRLVEELKIGDWAEIIKPGLPYYTGQIGKIIRVDDADQCGYPYQMEDKSWWSAKSLRKLTPEEVVFHTGTIGYKMQECSEEIEKATEAMRDLLAPLVDERLAAIEKRLDVQEDAIIEMDLRLDVDSEAIKVLEGERPEVIYREQFRIPENVSISMSSDANGKVTIDYSSGGFDLAKAVLDSMREA